MPIIVPIEENHEGIARLTDAKFRAPDYSGSGLEALGAGLARLGEGGAQFASALDEKRKRELAAAVAAAKLDDDHQRYIDDAAVKNAYVDYSDLTHEALHGDDGLFKQPGAKAHAALPDLVAKLADNHDKVLSKLDPVQCAGIASVLGARLRGDVDTAADHVRAQAKAEQAWQVEKLKQSTLRDAVASLADPERHDHHMATGENATIKQGRIKNLSDREIGRQVADFKSAVHAATIDALTEKDPVHAAGWYARCGDKLNDVDKQRIEAKLGLALADARAVADVDAASASDSATAPTNPHAGDDATLLLKMQGITPMMDHTALPALMQRYGNDPARAWAAFEAGPETVDRLIRQHGDDWYPGLDDDTRRFVDGNMRMLGGANSLRNLPADPQAAAAWIGVQPWEGPRKSAAIQELDQRAARNSEADTGSIIPASLTRFYGSQSPGFYPQPVLDITAPATDAGAMQGSPSSGTNNPTKQQSGTSPTANTSQSRSATPVISQARIDRNRAQAESDVRDPYFRALMTLIGRYEGPDNPNFGNGYYTINGHLKKGDGLKDLSVYPENLGDTAIGRYQIKRNGVWAYAAPSLGIQSFTPHDQDLIAAYTIRHQGIYDLLRDGNYAAAAAKISPTWAAFPMKDKPRGQYNQAHNSYEEFVRDFAIELANEREHPVQPDNRYLESQPNPYLRKRPMGLFEYYIPPANPQ